MKKISRRETLNLTQHQATREQIKEGVVEPEDKKEVQTLLTFGNIAPTREDLLNRAIELTRLAVAHGAAKVMIGGAPYLMAPLERALETADIKALYSFTEREVIEETQPDGTIKKTAVFKHAGWVPAA